MFFSPFIATQETIPDVMLYCMGITKYRGHKNNSTILSKVCLKCKQTLIEETYSRTILTQGLAVRGQYHRTNYIDMRISCSMKKTYY